VDGYLDDEDFVSAIKEDYPLITTCLTYQIDILHELENLDSKNSFLQANTVVALQDTIKAIGKERDEFTAKISNKDKIIDESKEKPAEEIFL
jgi:hypothetical protein